MSARHPLVESLSTSLLDRDGDAPLTNGGVVAWWESRRLPYNVAVGLSGMVSIGTIAMLARGFPGAPNVPWQPVVAYGVTANVMYTGGWMMELLLRRLGRPTENLGPALFGVGLLFSISLTLLPAVIMAAGTVFARS